MEQRGVSIRSSWHCLSMSAPLRSEELPGEDGNTHSESDAETEFEWVFPAVESPALDGSLPFDFDDWPKSDFDGSDNGPEPTEPQDPSFDCQRCRDGHRLHTHTFGYATLKRDNPILLDTEFRYPTFRQMVNANISDDFQRLKSAIEALALLVEKQLISQTSRNANLRGRPNKTPITNRSRRVQKMLDQCTLVYGAPKNQALWDHHRLLLMQGALWSNLLDTILQDKFAVFGTRARHLAREWATRDFDVVSATWRRITAEQLLIKCGIAQCEFTGEEIRGESLRALLHNTESLEHTKGVMTNALMKYRHRKYSDEKLQDARDDVATIFQDADPVARQSIHEARLPFVKSVQDWTGSSLKDSIEEVATHAQVLAIHMAVSSRSYDLIVPTLGQKIDHVQHRSASCCTVSRAGRIIFVLHPGIKEYGNTGDEQVIVIRRAQVFHDGSLDDDEMPVSTTPPPDRTPEVGSMQGGHVSRSHRDVLDGPSEIDIPVLRQFMELKSDIISLTKFLDTYPGLDQQRELRHFTISDNNAKIPWRQPQRNHMYRESVIWNVLKNLLDIDTFGILGNYNDRLSFSKIMYSGAGGDEERNQWRWFSARQMLNRLGGTAVFAPSPKFDVRDNELFQHVETRREETYDRIASRLLGRVPQPPLERLELIVKKAALLSAMLLIRKSRLVVFSPEINTRLVHWDNRGVELTDGYPSDREGRVEFVVCPGLLEIGDLQGENLDSNNPTYRSSCLVKLEGQHVPATKNPTEVAFAGRGHPPFPLGRSPSSSLATPLPLSLERLSSLSHKGAPPVSVSRPSPVSISKPLPSSIDSPLLLPVNTPLSLSVIGPSPPRRGPLRFNMPPQHNDFVRPDGPSGEDPSHSMSGGRSGQFYSDRTIRQNP